MRGTPGFVNLSVLSRCQQVNICRPGRGSRPQTALCMPWALRKNIILSTIIDISSPLYFPLDSQWLQAVPNAYPLSGPDLEL